MSIFAMIVNLGRISFHLTSYLSRKKEEAAEQKRCEEESARLHQAEMGEQLPPEPAAGKNVSTLRFRFPDGSTKSRRFLQDARLSVLFIYIGSEGFAEVNIWYVSRTLFFSSLHTNWCVRCLGWIWVRRIEHRRCFSWAWSRTSWLSNR